MTVFHEGLEVRYRQHSGFVDFVSEKYITICIRKTEDRSKNVCILIYPQQWKEIELIHGNRQSYEK
jgi:hypothetical protein